jgi:hypothetical protein
MSTRGSTLAALIAALVLLSACASRRPGSALADKSLHPGESATSRSSAGPSSAPRVSVPPAGTVTASAGTVGPGTSLPPTPTSRPSNIDLDPQAGATIRVDQSDDGATVTLRVGQHLVLTLAGSWTPPRAAPSPGAVAAPLRTDTSRGYPVAPPATAQFSAVATGTAQVTALTDAACFHTSPRCLMAQRMFAVRVYVLPQRSQ